MIKKISLFILFLSFISPIIAQLDSAIIHGKISGYWRNFYMNTTNQGSLQDWNALATGGLLKYETESYRNFKIGVGYYSSYNLNIEDITVKDFQTNKGSRYESGLFNVQNLTQKEIHYLGELYLKYIIKNHELTIGRMKLKSPFLNPQDGRMIPTLAQGIWYKNQSFNKIKINLGWITHIAPRSFNGFKTTAQTMGVYASGLNTDGTKSDYAGNITSAGLGIFAIHYKNKNFKIEAWDYFLENVFNSSYLLSSYQLKSWKISGQYLFQTKVKNGGNDDFSKSYFQDQMSMLWGLQLQKKVKQNWTFSANFNHITQHGRFLFPREWGRETLFTFQKRERQEGLSNSKSWVIDASKKWDFKNKSKLNVKIGYGYYYRADVKNVAENKYVMPANDQLNIDITYQWKNISAEYILMHKGLKGNDYDKATFLLNKVNMWHYNLILNYRF